MSTRLVIISGGLGQPSSTRLLADRLAGAVQREVSARGEGIELEVIELRPLARDIADHLTSGLPSNALRDALAAVSGADAVIAVTPVFTASYSGLFKSFVDLLDPQALVGTPVLIAATGGTARHSMVLDTALRPLFAYLRAVVLPTGVFAATDDFGGVGDGAASLDRRVSRAADELAEQLLARAGQSAVGGFTPNRTDEVGKIDQLDADRVTPFAQLLRGSGT